MRVYYEKGKNYARYIYERGQGDVRNQSAHNGSSSDEQIVKISLIACNLPTDLLGCLLQLQISLTSVQIYVNYLLIFFVYFV